MGNDGSVFPRGFHPVSSFHGALAAPLVNVGGGLASAGAAPSSVTLERQGGGCCKKDRKNREKTMREDIPLTSESPVLAVGGRRLQVAAQTSHTWSRFVTQSWSSTVASACSQSGRKKLACVIGSPTRFLLHLK